MQMLIYSPAAATSVCFSNLASLTGAAFAHTLTPAQHSPLPVQQLPAAQIYSLCPSRLLMHEAEQPVLKENLQLHLEVPAVTVIMYGFINLEVLL